MIYSKTLNTDDYADLQKESKKLAAVEQILKESGTEYFNQHHHRYWEYGMVMSAIKNKFKNRKKLNILDIGGAGSLLGATLAKEGYAITQVDPHSSIHSVNRQNPVLGTTMTAIQSNVFNFNTEEKYNVVMAISVMEHVPNDMEFIHRAAGYVANKGLLIITTDFHKTGKARLPWHMRTYNEEMLMNIASSMKDFSVYKTKSDYSYYEENVNNYTFASLILEKSK